MARVCAAILGSFLCVTMMNPVAALSAPGLTTLFTFPGTQNDEGHPIGALTADANGNLYGTAIGSGGRDRPGNVFELVRPAPGHYDWTEQILHRFTGAPRDGAGPIGGVVFGRDGALYGCTAAGGYSKNGTVYRIARAGNGWTETVLHDFNRNADGSDPHSRLAVGADGSLFGTTTLGAGAQNSGEIFRISPPARGRGQWQFATLYNFATSPGDSGGDGLVIGPSGVLYGASTFGGNNGGGDVYSLTDSPNGWIFTILYTFNRQGSQLAPDLLLDSSGNIYGETDEGPVGTYGEIYRLSPVAGGTWKKTILHTFAGTDGFYPQTPLSLGPNGVLYGTTPLGGPEFQPYSKLGHGVAFELVPRGNLWTEHILYAFGPGGQAPTGDMPYGPLFVDPNGVLFGTSLNGGTRGAGTVFTITP